LKEKFWKLPEKETVKKTVRDAISHLPPLEAGEISDIPYHYAPYWDKRYTDVMKHTPTGCSAFLNPDPWKPVNENGSDAEFYRSSWRRAKWDEPCGSILMKSAGMGGMVSCHPGTLQPDGTYLTSMNKNVKRSQKYNREAGLWQCLAPIGYLNVKDERRKSTLILDPERAPIIKQIFEKYASGVHSLKSVWLSKEFKENVGNAIDFASDLSNLMKIASPDEKNMLLKKLLTNCVLDGEVFKIRD
jgi:modification methylase hgaIA